MMSHFARVVARGLLAVIVWLGMAYASPSFAQPVVNSVSVPANGTYGAGQNLDFTVNFSAAVLVDTSGGTPRVSITMNVGGTVYASYLAGSGTSALTFRYTIVSGESDSDGITVGASIDLNGGTIQDAMSINAVLALNSVGSTIGVLVDSIAPTAVGMTVPADGNYTDGQNLDFTVTFSEVVLVTGTPNIPITLDVGGSVQANYISGSGTNTLNFGFTVQPGQQDMTGIVLGADIAFNGGSIQDAATNTADASISAVAPSTAGITVNAATPVRLQSFEVE
jgi:hypothetical protein